MVKGMEISNRTSKRKGKSVTVYLRAEHLETLDRLAKPFNNDKSKAVQFMLETVKAWLDGIFEKKPEVIMSMIQKEMQEAIEKTLQLAKNL